MSSELAAKRILLAGGSGGLGGASARLLANEGADLVISYRANRERAESFGHIAKIVQCDLTSEEDRARLLEAAGDLYGLVVFTGDPSRVSDPSQYPAAMRHAFAVNCEGPLLLARAVAERMKQSKTPGSIVLFSTMQASALFPNSTPYAAAKAALAHGARILAKELRGPSNIRVNVVCPGVIAAGMAEASIASGKYNSYLESGTVSRFGHPQDIARAVRFILQPDSYVTGQVLVVDGGLTL